MPESIVAIPLFHGSTIEGVLGFSFRESLVSELVDQTKIIVWLTMISELYIVKDGSHVPQADFPDLINHRLLRFITKIEKH